MITAYVLLVVGVVALMKAFLNEYDWACMNASQSHFFTKSVVPHWVCLYSFLGAVLIIMQEKL